ncbi:MAG TPA: hypothetical protein PLE30_02045 [Candidatus Kapabacteria bacterium]|nr:hypothetical protein [Candidatus Kapabacteria bacterium]
MAERTLSIYLNTDKVYLTGIAIDSNHAAIEYIESTNYQIDLENIDSHASQQAITDLESILNNMEFKANKLTITLPAESIFITRFPAKFDFSKDQLKQLVSLELRQAYPEFSFDNFDVRLVPIQAIKSQSESMIAMMILKSDLTFLSNLFAKYNLEISNYEIAPFAAYSTFMFNYPEMRDKSVLLIGYQGKFLDFSVHKDGKILYYNINSISNESQIGEATEKEFLKIQETVLDAVDATYFYGSSLTRNITLSLWETAMVLGIMEAKRLNPFRMLSTTLDKRYQEYCSRTFQIYPPCIGSALKRWHNIVDI